MSSLNSVSSVAVEEEDLAALVYRECQRRKAEAAAAPVAAAKTSSLHIKSLTVRISNDEVWRCPPSSHHDEDDFEWPPGWIEVHRLPPRNDDEHQNEVREFHPPSLTRVTKRKQQVFYTIAEVKKYLQQQEAKQKKDARICCSVGCKNKVVGAGGVCKRHGTSSPRRSTSRRRTNPQNSSSNTNQSYEGSVDALNKIMKVDNKFSQNMRQSILIAAVICQKRKEPYSQFLGSDGRTYPDLRSAFGKHISIKQCELCKQRVQGPFYCRIAHEHLDVPDYDGGNSYECLRDLFKCSVDDLVERHVELLYGGEGSRKRKAIEPTPSVLDGLDDDNISSMDLMSEEVLLQIALFIPNLSCLISFCKTSKRMQKLLYTSVHSEKLFRGPFLQTFGKSGMIGNFEMNLSWRERWRMIYGLRRGLVHQHSSDMLSLNDTRANLLRPRQTIGVLSQAEENSALFYDNPDWNFTDDSSNGYFGMKVLHLPPPPNAANNWQPPVVCHGDFNGIKMFNSVSSIFENQNAQPRFVSLGDDEGGGQALAIIQCDVSPLKNEQTNRSQPSFFIGFASGRVAAVNATIAECGQKYNFCISGFHDAHEHEVTSLVFVNSISSGGKCGKLLYSACGGGQVYCYPNALCPAHNFSMEESVLAFSSNVPIFSMASTTIRTDNHSFAVICTGDGEGKIRLWTRPYEGLLVLTPPEPVPFHRSETNFVPSQVKQAGTRTGLVTRMKFVHNEDLVTCTNNGDLRIWKLQCCKPYRHSDVEKGPKPQLELKYDKMGLHNGAVEVVNNVGDMLLTSGGNDGKVIGVDLHTGLILESIDCHTGERLQHREGTALFAKSCVVDIILSGKEGCMISLCRDGTLQRWNFV